MDEWFFAFHSVDCRHLRPFPFSTARLKPKRAFPWPPSFVGGASPAHLIPCHSLLITCRRVSCHTFSAPRPLAVKSGVTTA